VATISPPLGAVSLGSHLPGGVAGVGSIVGDPPQWSDGSDTTYAYLPVRGSFGGAAYARTNPVAGEVIRATVTLRTKSVDTDEGVVSNVVVYAGRTPSATFPTLFLIDFDVPTDGAIHELTGSIDFGPELFEVTGPDWSTVGFHVEVGNGGSRETYVYQVALTLTLTDARATRLYPRDDALGLGAGARIYPPPRSRRLVGGQH
jgi:hypothetical protein